jgi:hypothetical protein
MDVDCDLLYSGSNNGLAPLVPSTDKRVVASPTVINVHSLRMKETILLQAHCGPTIQLYRMSTVVQLCSLTE